MIGETIMFNPEKLLGGLIRSSTRGRRGGLGGLVSGGAQQYPETSADRRSLTGGARLCRPGTAFTGGPGNHRRQG